MYILTISNNSNLKPEFIAELKQRHQTEQEPVVTRYVDEDLPNGFVITKDDNLFDGVAKTYPEIIKDKDAKRIIHEQRRIIKENAKFSKDTSITDNEKPYKPTK